MYNSMNPLLKTITEKRCGETFTICTFIIAITNYLIKLTHIELFKILPNVRKYCYLTVL